jgi:hypothetical protein
MRTIQSLENEISDNIVILKVDSSNQEALDKIRSLIAEIGNSYGNEVKDRIIKKKNFKRFQGLNI